MTGPARPRQTLPRLLLGAVLLVLAQAGIGMVVNLYVVVPPHHPGAQPASYLSGSFRSVVWALGHAAPALAVHAALGLVLVVYAAVAAVYAVRAGRRGVAAWTIAGGLLVIGAGFNGASFLDFGHALSSLIMALLALGAIACYVAALYSSGQSSGQPRSR